MRRQNRPSEAQGLAASSGAFAAVRLRLRFQSYAIRLKTKSISLRRRPRYRTRRYPMFRIHAKGCSTTARTDAIIRLSLFWSGQSFDEPGLSPDPPDTKFKSAGIRHTSAAEINAKDFKRWLKKSVDIQWDYKNIVKRKGMLLRLK